MTREEIAAIDRECEEQHISQQDYLSHPHRQSGQPLQRPHQSKDVLCLRLLEILGFSI